MGSIFGGGSGGTQTNVNKFEPWKPAEPYLEDLLKKISIFQQPDFIPPASIAQPSAPQYGIINQAIDTARYNPILSRGQDVLNQFMQQGHLRPDAQVSAVPQFEKSNLKPTDVIAAQRGITPSIQQPQQQQQFNPDDYFEKKRIRTGSTYSKSGGPRYNYEDVYIPRKNPIPSTQTQTQTSAPIDEYLKIIGAI